MSNPRRLMLSQKMLDQLGPRILQHTQGHAVELVSIESAVAAQRRDIDAVFISREVTGTSTKHEVHPELQACYDLMLANAGLQWVHIHSAGADRPVYQALQQRGVQVTTSSGANARVVAAMALAGLLALNKRFPMLWAQQQRREWVPLLGAGRMPRDLPGKPPRSSAGAHRAGTGAVADGTGPERDRGAHAASGITWRRRDGAL